MEIVYLKVMRQRAIFTIIREEAFYLPKWYKYYSRFFEDCDMYIIHHVTDVKDKSVDFLRNKVNIIPIEQEFFSTRWIRDVVQEQQHKLLESYRVVLFGDVDEIIFTNPSKHTDIGSFINWFDDQNDINTVKCCSFTIMHQPDKELPFNYDHTIMSQRKYWYRYAYYDKPLISKVPLHLEFGFHHCKEPGPVLSYVLMIHLHQFDFDWYMKRHTRWADEYKVAAEDLEGGWNYHYRKKNDELKHQFYHYYGTDQKIIPTDIPNWVEKQLAI